MTALAVTAAVAAGCGSARREAEEAVRAYDEALVAAFRASDPRGLAHRVTDRELRKATTLIDLKNGSGLVLESALESLEVLEASRPAPDRLLASTRERWRYFDRPLDPAASPGPTVVAVMDLDYELVREAGAWKVDRVRGKSTQYLEPKGFKPHQGAEDGKPEPGGGSR